MAALATNLITVMVFKQMGVNIVEYLQDKVMIGRKIKKIKLYFEQKLSTMDNSKEETIALEEVKMHWHMEE